MEHLNEREEMKFVLNGRSFDTATSSPVAISRGVQAPDGFGQFWDSRYNGAEQVRFDHTLFRTAKGNFFVHDHYTIKFPKGKPVVEDDATELTPVDAVKWIAENEAAVLDGTNLPLPDEA